jgi:hypothetical protein
MIISYSGVLKWDTCKKQYHYGFVQNIRTITESLALTTGLKGHKLLQNYYTYLSQGFTKEEAHKKTTQSAMELMSADKLNDGLLIAWTLVDNFIRDTEIMAEAVLIENRFLFPASKLFDHPLLADVQIGFTPDVVFKRTGDFYDVEDAKFVGRAWSESKLNHFKQAKLYQIMLTRMGYNVSRSIVRFFNTKTGKSNAITSVLKPGEEESIITDFTAALIELVKAHTEPDFIFRRTMDYNTCSFCPFERPCALEARGLDSTQSLNTEFVRSTYDYTR